MPETSGSEPVRPPNNGIPSVPDMSGAKELETAAAHGAAAEHHGHGFNFDSLNASHTLPYPAIEPIHGHPWLILNLAEYADVNFAALSTSPEFDRASTSGNETWAGTYIARKQSFLDDVTGKHKVFPTSSENLAKAMTVARQEAFFGTMPESVSFLNQQTFWSSIALILGAVALLVFGRRKSGEHQPANRFQHMLEAIALYVRNEIVRPNIKHHADWWTPYFGAIFLAILVCNLVGLIPVCATATGNIAVTAALALTTMVLMLWMGLKENGPVKFWIHLVPVKWTWNPLNIVLWLFLFVLELAQLVIRPAVLAVRLFVNMFAGHSVLLVFASLGFIIYAGDHSAHLLSSGLGIAGWILTILLYALELLVAFLQAYIFTLLSAVFIGLCAHPEH